MYVKSELHDVVVFLSLFHDFKTFGFIVVARFEDFDDILELHWVNTALLFLVDGHSELIVFNFINWLLNSDLNWNHVSKLMAHFSIKLEMSIINLITNFGKFSDFNWDL